MTVKKIKVDKYQLNQFLLDVCKRQDFKEIKYWLTSPELEDHADIHANNDDALVFACLRSHTEVIKYLTSSPDLKEHSNVNADDDKPFILAYENHNDEILRYFIFDLNIEQSEAIVNHMKTDPRERVDKWFEQRDLIQKLNDELPMQSNTIKKLKL